MVTNRPFLTGNTDRLVRTKGGTGVVDPPKRSKVLGSDTPRFFFREGSLRQRKKKHLRPWSFDRTKRLPIQIQDSSKGLYSVQAQLIIGEGGTVNLRVTVDELNPP